MLRQTCCASAKSLIQVIQELACSVQVYQIDERVGRASVVRAHDDVVLGARGQATQLPTAMKTRDPDTTRQAVKAECRSLSRNALPWWSAKGGLVDVR